MSAGGSSDRLLITWTNDARADMRALDRATALNIVYCVDRYLSTENGDVKTLRTPLTGYRLRCGDYRIFFMKSGRSLSVDRVKHRKDAYR